MASVHDHLIHMRGLRFHFREWSCPKAEAQDLVLLHGFTGHARSWDALAQAMSADYRVLALDQRGHGETEWAPPDQYGAAHMVADLEAFIAALGLHRMVLLGLSMGGNVAIHYAGQQPETLERLVIIDIGPEIAAGGLNRIYRGVQAQDVFKSPEDAFAQARAANALPPEAHHWERVINNLMRLEDGTDLSLRPSPRQNHANGPAPRRAGVRWQCRPKPTDSRRASDILAPNTRRVCRDIPSANSLKSPVAALCPLDQPDGFQAVRDFLIPEARRRLDRRGITTSDLDRTLRSSAS